MLTIWNQKIKTLLLLFMLFSLTLTQNALSDEEITRLSVTVPDYKSATAIADAVMNDPENPSDNISVERTADGKWIVTWWDLN